MPNIKLTLEYDGTRYHGWQRQPDRETIQGTLERAILAISGERVKLIGAGRTDAGAHALGQVANFKTRRRLSPAAWQRALNSLLPEDIRVSAAAKVDGRFHARYDAVEKTYTYRIRNHPTKRAIGRQYIWTVYPPLDPARMRRGAGHLTGRHDFTAFRAGGNRGPDSSVCRIRKLDITRTGDEIRMTLTADRFLHQMVRTIVGTLVEVGKAKRDPADVKRILDGRKREKAGQTAPARGLVLLRVKY
jgi:tRNA pseudouridine38-40 synthase